MLIFYKICCNHLIYLLYQIFFKKSNYLILVVRERIGLSTNRVSDGHSTTELPHYNQGTIIYSFALPSKLFSKLAEKVGVEPTV